MAEDPPLDLQSSNTNTGDCLTASPYLDHASSESVLSTSDSKVNEILQACHESSNTETLKALATTPGGLINDELRRKAWPKLLRCGALSIDRNDDEGNRWRSLPAHKDEDQVNLDVNRAFVYYPQNESERQVDKRKSQLSDLIIRVLRQHPRLSYFQGYHDVAQVFLLVLGTEYAPRALAHLSLLQIRDFMLPTLSPSVAQLNMLPSILQAVDLKLYQHLSATQPFFALSATLTMYAHDIQNYGEIARLFDFLIAHPAVVSLYFFAIIILSRREELFETPADDAAMLHSILSKLPKPLNLEGLIQETKRTFAEHPPESLPNWAWWKISSFSALKSTRWGLGNQTLAEGEQLFEAQARQLSRQETRRRIMTKTWQHRGALMHTTIAICIVAFSYWIGQRTGVEPRLIQRMRNIWKPTHWLPMY